MNTRQFREEAFAYALKAGCTGAEMVETQGKEFAAGVLAGAVESYTVSRTRALGLRVQVEGHDGYASTEAPADPAALVRAAMDNARAVESEDTHPMASPGTYQELPQPPDALHGMSERQKIQLCMELEQAALAADPRVKRVSNCQVITVSAGIAIHNTLGLSLIHI